MFFSTIQGQGKGWRTRKRDQGSSQTTWYSSLPCSPSLCSPGTATFHCSWSNFPPANIHLESTFCWTPQSFFVFLQSLENSVYSKDVGWACNSKLQQFLDNLLMYSTQWCFTDNSKTLRKSPQNITKYEYIGRTYSHLTWVCVKREEGIVGRAQQFCLCFKEVHHLKRSPEPKPADEDDHDSQDDDHLCCFVLWSVRPQSEAFCLLQHFPGSTISWLWWYLSSCVSHSYSWFGQKQ